VGKRYKRAIRAHKRELWESATKEQLELIKKRCGKAIQGGEVWESDTRKQLELKKKVWESATRERIEERCGKALQERN
jgi:hypothetical protein